jgi:hypothetical protein
MVARQRIGNTPLSPDLDANAVCDTRQKSVGTLAHSRRAQGVCYFGEYPRRGHQAASSRLRVFANDATSGPVASRRGLTTTSISPWGSATEARNDTLSPGSVSDFGPGPAGKGRPVERQRTGDETAIPAQTLGPALRAEHDSRTRAPSPPLDRPP